MAAKAPHGPQSGSGGGAPLFALPADITVLTDRPLAGCRRAVA
jgi:hypothetical protein